MKLTLRNTFDLTPEAFWRDVFFNQAFLERMYREALGCVSVAFLEQSGEPPDVRTRRLTFTQPFEAPGPIRKLFGDTTTMEERGELDAATKRWRYTMTPDRMGDKIRITGETRITTVGEGKIERTDDIELTVSLFGVGGLVEKFMGGATEESFARQAAFTREYIRSRARN